jgi:hypothetical protein
METKVISKNKFNNLMPLKLSSDIVNTEAVIYHYRYNSDYDGVLKKLYNTSGGKFASKLYTLEMLDYYRDILPNSFVIPDALVSVKGEVVGFCMPLILGDNLNTILRSSNAQYDKQIFYLKKIGLLLDELKYIRKYNELKDIYLGDLQECNFVVPNGSMDLKVIDLDSCKICNNTAMASRYLIPNSLFSRTDTLKKYIICKDDNALSYVIPNESSDLYCYNIMILNYLYGSNVNRFSLDEFYDYLKYLEYIGINSDLINSISCIGDYRDNCNIGNYLDSITRENVFRAKKNVYEKVKKNK